MCGIAGAWDFTGRSIPMGRIAAMSREQQHRGPDGDGVFSNGPLFLANQRLAIIDPDDGDQPFMSDDGTVALVQNGEIFNFVELADELRGHGVRFRTHCDTEVLLQAYLHWGPDFVRRLNGMFAIAIWDARDRTLRLYRDRIGIKPLFYHEDGKGFSFASEIKALLAGGVSANHDPQALDLFFTYNYVPPPHTAFRGIFHLPPGTMAEVVEGGRISRRRWWTLCDRDIASYDEDAWSTRFLELFEDAVRLRLRADVPFGAFLSGGVDSASVVGFMSRQLPAPVKTFSIGFDDPRFDESAYAREVAARFGTDHIEEIVTHNIADLWPKVAWHLDQPHGDVSFMPTYRVAQLAGRHVKMVLTGDGGDELFAGYDKYRAFFADHDPDTSDDAFRSAYLANISLLTDEQKRTLYRSSFAHDVDPHSGRMLLDRHFDEMRHWDRLNQALGFDMQVLLAGNNLVKPDRMGMAVGVEARTPMLDYRMMEFAFTTPPSFKLRAGETKYAFKKAVAPMIGEQAAYRRKQMFTVPIGEWLKGDMAEYARELLLQPDGFTSSLLRREAVERMIEDHVTGRANNTREVRAFMALELWGRRFLQGKDHDG